MTMTKEEIVRDYMQAKAPQKQIGILADLNACEKKEIVEILKEAGAKLPGNYYNTPPKRTPAPKAETVVKTEDTFDRPAQPVRGPIDADEQIAALCAENSRLEDELIALRELIIRMSAERLGVRL